jgi:uncharacterized protein YhhL (DUF1145 family)
MVLGVSKTFIVINILKPFSTKLKCNVSVVELINLGMVKVKRFTKSEMDNR